MIFCDLHYILSSKRSFSVQKLIESNDRQTFSSGTFSFRTFSYRTFSFSDIQLYGTFSFLDIQLLGHSAFGTFSFWDIQLPDIQL